MRAALLALLAAAPALAGALPGPAAEVHVHIVDGQFSPDVVGILAGEAVRWHNHDVASHDATADDASWSTGTLGEGASAAVGFAAAGTRPYYCSIHNSMVGQVLVSAPGALPDLAFGGIEGAPVWPVPGVATWVNVTVRNLGLAEAPAGEVAVSYRYQGEEHPIGTAALPRLGPGAAGVASLEWDTLGKVGGFRVAARADPEGLVEEGDEANNAGEATVAPVLQGHPPLDVLDPL